MTTDLIKIKCFEKECEYKRVASDFCDLNDDEMADCCPKNSKELK